MNNIYVVHNTDAIIMSDFFWSLSALNLIDRNKMITTFSIKLSIFSFTVNYE